MPKRILIAEDEASVRNAMRTFIESRSQFQVCEAVDGDDAIKKANVLQPDLVVLDLRMPKANGIEVAALLHVRTPHTPVVVFTMFEDKLSASLTKVLGIAAVVPKSDGVAKLLGRIEALLDAQDALAMQRH
jgi:DNA-binding NarL/FixJ family response regulator